MKRASRLTLSAELLQAIREERRRLSEQTIAAVIAEVPAYRESVGPQRRLIEEAVEQTITVFVDLVAEGVDPETSSEQDPALDGGFALGRAEARGGRSSDMLLAAYRVGARTVWRRWSGMAVDHDLPGVQLALFAEWIFAYMDRLSASAVAGHAEELAKAGLARQRARETLVRGLLTSATGEELSASAERAEWVPPRTLTAVAVPNGRVASATRSIDPRTLDIPEDAVRAIGRSRSMLLVPDIGGDARQPFLTNVAVQQAVVGPTRPWAMAAESVRRAERAITMNLRTGSVLDTEEHLVELVAGADQSALADLRTRALKPLQHLRPVVRQNLITTLRAWLLHHGRRDDIAAELFVHPGTVRYRLNQLRDAFGDRLNDPRTILELTIALAVEPTTPRDIAEPTSDYSIRTDQ